MGLAHTCRSCYFLCISAVWWISTCPWMRHCSETGAFCKFSLAMVIPSALRRIWRSDIAASGKVTWHQGFVHGVTRMSNGNQMGTISQLPANINRSISEGSTNPGAFCRPKISSAVAANVYWTTQIRPSICVIAFTTMQVKSFSELHTQVNAWSGVEWWPTESRLKTGKISAKHWQNLELPEVIARRRLLNAPSPAAISPQDEETNRCHGNLRLSSTLKIHNH